MFHAFIHLFCTKSFPKKNHNNINCSIYDEQNAGPAPSPIGQLPPNEGMPGGPMTPNFFPVSFF